MQHATNHDVPNNALQATCADVRGRSQTLRKKEYMKAIRTFDFSQLPAIEAMDIIIRLDWDVHTALIEGGPLPEVHERAQAALMFMCGTAQDKEPWRNSAFLRAGLNEFYSIEDAARRDCRRNLPSVKPPPIRESCSPLVHLMYLLRHVNVHAEVSRTRVHQTSVRHTHQGETKEVGWGSVVIDGPTLDQLQKCNEAKQYYAAGELASASAWLDDVQHTFGIGVFRRGLSAYCRELLRDTGQLAATPNRTMHAT